MLEMHCKNTPPKPTADRHNSRLENKKKISNVSGFTWLNNCVVFFLPQYKNLESVAICCILYNAWTTTFRRTSSKLQLVTTDPTASGEHTDSDGVFNTRDF